MIPDENITVEHRLEGLLRGDTAARTAYYTAGRQWGWLSVNDIRELESMELVENGDEYLVPMNMTEAGAPPPEPAVKENNLIALKKQA